MKVILRGVLIVVVALAAACLGPGSVSQSPGNTLYYVDSLSGDDGNSGRSSDLAWKTLDPVNETAFASGDKILFKAGSRYSGRLAPKGSGSESAPVVVGVYGDGPRPRIDAEGRYGEALLLNNQEYWEVSGLELTNEGRERVPFRYGVRVAAWDFGIVHHIYLKDLFVHDVNGSLIKEDRGEGHGILWENGGKRIPSRFDGLRIEKCHLLRTDRNGISGYSENSDRESWFPSLNVVIRENLLQDIGGDGIKVWGCDGAVVEHNRLEGGRTRCDDYAAGIWPWSSDNTLIQFNEVSGVKGTKDGQAFDSDGNCMNTIFQYNYSHDNEGGFMLICSSGNWKLPRMVPNTGTIVRYNISQGDQVRTFHIAGTIEDAQIYNNVFYVSKDQMVDVLLFSDWDGWSQGVSFENNIVYSEGTARYRHATARIEDGLFKTEDGFGLSLNNRFENNVYFGKQEALPPDARAYRKDPLLVDPGSGGTGFDSLNGYQLQAASPCIDAGIQIDGNGGRDFWGNPVPEEGKPDIGANERQPK